jgi:hypothetical protein
VRHFRRYGIAFHWRRQVAPRDLGSVFALDHRDIAQARIVRGCQKYWPNRTAA